jgi:hypothetical protein
MNEELDLADPFRERTTDDAMTRAHRTDHRRFSALERLTPSSEETTMTADVQGHPLHAGHFFPEEAPEATAAVLGQFFGAVVICPY